MDSETIKESDTEAGCSLFRTNQVSEMKLPRKKQDSGTEKSLWALSDPVFQAQGVS